MRTYTRRESLKILSATAAAWVAGPVQPLVAAEPRKLGIAMYSYSNLWKSARDNTSGLLFHDPLTFLEHAHTLGARGIQTSIGNCARDYAEKLRGRAETLGMYLEGQLTLPAQPEEVGRFESELKSGKAAGVDIFRTAALSGRRYETFKSAEEFHDFKKRSWTALTLAEPVIRKHRCHLAIENHKDWLIEEMLANLKRLSSEHVGVLVDTGNSIALLEEPMELVEAYAPYAVSTHIKDMGVEPCEDGFLLSEVPLGEGFLDLRKIMDVLARANPRIRWNLEMITRNPLVIPCLTKEYWATMGSVSGERLARLLRVVREKKSSKPLPRITGLSPESILEAENENVRLCLQREPG